MKKLLSFILICALFPIAEAKNYYRFKNSEGQIIVVDYVTPEALASGYEVLNAEGKLIQRVSPAKTIGELEEEKKRQKEIEKAKRDHQRQLKRDAELLRLFASVNDITRAREAQMQGIEQRKEINVNERNLLLSNLEQLQGRAADYERLGTKVPDKLKQNIVETQKQINQRINTATLIQQEKENIAKRFEKDIIRFKELQAKRLAHRLDRDAKKNDKGTVAIYDCENNEQCGKIWQLAQVYAANNATGKLEIITDTLILTASPATESDIALSFSKVPGRHQTQVVLEISCHSSDAGTQLCASSHIRSVRDGFIQLVEKQL
ncbi:hypothetical protein [Pleionea sp. CnH1-48]|uniref:hypothetical protein n=1 Tax=Pleionea sp. CnH1-48 TaxID=2954494 RepID=UPI002097B9AD|nr:hypothetical protein [Pleionea sp. CnH1-48]MCO7224444.1 hypothetical protein [Pleionea sp. CnH1-48]